MKSQLNKISLFLFSLIIVFSLITCKETDVETVFQINFESNGGNQIESQEVIKGEKAIRPSNPKKTRNIFAGWYQDNNFERSFSFEMPVTKDITLYAKWREAFVVYYESDGGTEITPDTIPAGEVLTKPQNPTKDGNVFTGWYDATLNTAFNFSSTVLLNDTTLYAKWLSSIKVIFVTSSSAAVAPIEVLQGNSIAKPDNPIVADSTFMGWFTDETFTTQFDFNTPIEQETKLYASWLTNKFKYTVLANGSIAINGLKDEYSSETKIHIPGNIGGIRITRVWDNAFLDNKNITDLRIDEGVTNLHPNVFKGCSNLANITLPQNTLIGIGNYSFQLCTSLSGTIIIPDCVTGMGAGVFTQCSNIEEIHISIGISNVPRAFVGCSSLKKVVLKRNSVPALAAADAFGGTDSELKIFVPANLIDLYKTTTNWSNYATRFEALP